MTSQEPGPLCRKNQLLHELRKHGGNHINTVKGRNLSRPSFKDQPTILCPSLPRSSARESCLSLRSLKTSSKVCILLPLKHLLKVHVDVQTCKLAGVNFCGRTPLEEGALPTNAKPDAMSSTICTSGYRSIRIFRISATRFITSRISKGMLSRILWFSHSRCWASATYLPNQCRHILMICLGGNLATALVASCTSGHNPRTMLCGCPNKFHRAPSHSKTHFTRGLAINKLDFDTLITRWGTNIAVNGICGQKEGCYTHPTLCQNEKQTFPLILLHLSHLLSPPSPCDGIIWHLDELELVHWKIQSCNIAWVAVCLTKEKLHPLTLHEWEQQRQIHE